MTTIKKIVFNLYVWENRLLFHWNRREASESEKNIVYILLLDKVFKIHTCGLVYTRRFFFFFFLASSDHDRVLRYYLATFDSTRYIYAFGSNFRLILTVRSFC